MSAFDLPPSKPRRPLTRPPGHSMYSNPKGNQRMTTKARLRHGARGAAFIAGFLVSLAAAFFVATYLSEGTKEGKTGSAGNQAQPVNISFPDGLTPTNPVPVTATVENNSGGSRTWKSFKMEISTPTVPICGQQWLQLRPEKTDGTTSTAWEQIIAGTNTTPLTPISAGSRNIFNSGPDTLKAVYLEFKPALVGTTDQRSCENVSVKVTGKLTE